MVGASGNSSQTEHNRSQLLKLRNGNGIDLAIKSSKEGVDDALECTHMPIFAYTQARQQGGLSASQGDLPINAVHSTNQAKAVHIQLWPLAVCCMSQCLRHHLYAACTFTHKLSSDAWSSHCNDALYSSCPQPEHIVRLELDLGIDDGMLHRIILMAGRSTPVLNGTQCLLCTATPCGSRVDGRCLSLLHQPGQLTHDIASAADTSSALARLWDGFACGHDECVSDMVDFINKKMDTSGQHASASYSHLLRVCNTMNVLNATPLCPGLFSPQTPVPRCLQASVHMVCAPAWMHWTATVF